MSKKHKYKLKTEKLQLSKTLKTLTKDYNMDQVLVFDQRLIPFLLHCYVTPQGIVTLDSPGKKPRGVFDSSFRPTVWAVAINDMTAKDIYVESL